MNRPLKGRVLILVLSHLRHITSVALLTQWSFLILGLRPPPRSLDKASILDADTKKFKRGIYLMFFYLCARIYKPILSIPQVAHLFDIIFI